MTPEEESEYQYLGNSLGFLGGASPAPERPGLGGRLLKNIGNAPSLALEGLMGIGTGASDLVTGEHTAHAVIPKVFDLPTPQGIGEHLADLPGNLLGVAPQFVLPGGAAASIATKLGTGVRAANIIGQTVGGLVGGLAESPTTAVAQGGVGALQGFAERLPRPARGVLALGAGAIGAGQALASGGSASDALTFGALNTLATFASPQVGDAVRKTLKGNAIGIAEDHAAGAGVRPTEPIPWNPDAPGPSNGVAPLQIGQGPIPQRTGLPFYEVPPPLPVGPGGGLPILGQRATREQLLNLSHGPEHALTELPPRGALMELPSTPQPRELPPPGSLIELPTNRRVTEEAPIGIQSPPPEPVAPLQTAPHPQDKLPSGLQKKLASDAAWTPAGTPLGPSFTNDAYAFGKTFKTDADVKRAYKGAAMLEKHGMALLDNPNMTMEEMTLANEIVYKSQYLREAAEFAEGASGKVEQFKKYVDPNYEPVVPGKAYLESRANKFDIAAEATKANVEYQKSAEGLHAFKELSTGGNFSIKESELTPAKIQEKAEAMRQSGANFPPKTPEQANTEVDALLEKMGLAPSKPPNPTKPVEPAAPIAQAVEPIAALQKVQVQGRHGWEEATVLQREGDVVHMQVDDPIFGPRRASVLESETRPIVAREPTAASGTGTVPFKDVPGARNLLDTAHERFGGEGGLLESQLEGAGPGAAGLPGNVRKTLPGRERTNLSLIEGLAKLPKEAGEIIAQIFARMQQAVGHSISTDLARRMVGAKGGAYDRSGRVVLNLQWINQVVQHWEKLSPETRSKALMRVTALYGHEISHVVQQFGVKSELSINGKPLIEAIKENVAALSSEQRMHVAAQIKEAKGDVSHGVSKYLAGDLDAVYGWYKRLRPNLTRVQAADLAAGEFIAELGAVELVKRIKVEGLSAEFRAIVDRFKTVLVRVVDWFRGRKETEGVAALQNLQDISSKMYDHFAQADTKQLHEAFPASTEWRPPPVTPTPATLHPSVLPSVPAASAAAAPFVRKELAKLGLRALTGGIAGAVVGPTVSDQHMGLAESIIAGGVLGLFGPAIAKSVLGTALTKEISAAVAAGRGNTMATFKALVGGSTLTELGREGRYGWRGDGSTAAKVVRLFEQHFNLNFDPKLKAAIEQGRGIASKQFALIEDALKKARWVQPSQLTKDLTEKFIAGKIDKADYLAALQDDASKTFGNFIVAAREGTSVLTEMFSSGLRPSRFREAVIANRESYVGRFYRAYREGKFDMAYFDAVKRDLMSINPGMDMHNADALLREHMIEIKANRRLFGGNRGTGTQSLDTTLTFRRRATEEEIELQQMRVAELEHDPHSAEYQQQKSRLDWMEAHKITDNWRGWLGEIKDPTERLIYTFQKLYPSSIAGKIYDLLDNSINSLGNKFAYTGAELSNTRTLLQSEIASTTDAAKVTSLQNRLAELETYSPLPEGTSYGKLSGKFTDRFVRDHINTYDTPYKWMEQPFLRGIASINNLVKINRTVLNPLTAVRNYMQMPLFMLIARVGLDDLFQAVKVIHRNADPALLSIMRERHVLGVDYAAEELSTNLGHMVSGYFDSDAATRIAKFGYAKAREIYQQPDMLLRAGAFISARKRLAERMNLPIDHSAVLDAAVEAADRVTMNYATVPKAVKAARQLPFVSLFISYTSEISKIIKNLAVDAISTGTHQQDRMHAIGVLGAMAAIPPILVASFEGNLSPQDRKDWQQTRSLQPDYSRSRFLLPLYRDEQKRFHYMDMTTMIPADNYTQMIKASVQGDMAAAASANPFFSLQDTPLLNIATEQISGESLRTHDKISGVGRIREILQEVLPPIVPPGYEGQRLVRALSENKEGGLGTTNLRTGVISKPSDIVASYLTGMRFGNVSLATVQRQAVSEAKQAIAEQQQQLRDTANTNAALPTQLAAREHYRKAVEQIMLQLHSRMGTPKP